jgi:pimeloyl-ACP methyl ester carboxylesterase
MHHPLQIKLIRLYFGLVTPLFPKLAIYSAHRLFHYPINSKRKNRNALPLPTPELFDIPLYESVTLQGYRWGEANHPKVLLIHGWSTTSQSMTHFTDALLKSHYQIISYDALRHGDSHGSFSDLASWADSVHAALAEVGEVECIIAHSFGGAAVTVASKLELQTKKLALIAPIHDISAVADNFAKHLGIPLNIVKEMRAYTWEHNKANFEKYGKDWHDIVTSDFHVPTLIYHDKEDREIPIMHSELLCQKWTWTELRPTEGLGHRKILDDDAVVEGVVAFIQKDIHDME